MCLISLAYLFLLTWQIEFTFYIEINRLVLVNVFFFRITSMSFGHQLVDQVDEFSAFINQFRRV